MRVSRIWRRRSAGGVIEALAATRAAPGHLRMDDGPELTLGPCGAGVG